MSHYWRAQAKQTLKSNHLTFEVPGDFSQNNYHAFTNYE